METNSLTLSIKKGRWKPALTLLMLAPFLAEALSTHVSVSQLVQPLTFLLLATIGYGFPLLIIREVALRRKMGVTGLLLMGLAYGIYNEGLVAGTLTRSYDLPMPFFDGYGVFAGFNGGWALFITIWHAFHSVLYPLIFVYVLFPRYRDESWIGRKTFISISVLCFLAGTVLFAIDGVSIQTLVRYAIFMLSMSGLIVLAFLLRRISPLDNGSVCARGAFWRGALLWLIFFLLPVIASARGAPFWCYLAYYASAGYVVWWYLFGKRGVSYRTMVRLALGNELFFVLPIVLFSSVAGDVEQFVTSAGFFLLFLLGYFFIRGRGDV